MANDPRPVEQHLTEAQRRIDEGLKLICHQRGVIADLECGRQQGAGLERARLNLKTMMDAQALLVEERDRLQGELSKVNTLKDFAAAPLDEDQKSECAKP